MLPFHKAIKLLNNNKPEKALALFKKEFPFKEVLLNMGTCYRLMGDDKKAEEYYLKSIRSDVPFTDGKFSDSYDVGLNNLGLLAYTYEDDSLAAELFMQALKLNPNYVDASWNLGNTLLRMYLSDKFSDLSLCWDLYEKRFTRSEKPVLLKSKRKLLAWDGDPNVDLVVLTEQGFGDFFMFGRYLSLIKAKSLTVQCHPRLRSVVEAAGYKTCSDPIETTAEYGIGICSLGRIFNSDIPNGEWLSEQYIKKPYNGTLDIGVTWSGNPNHANNRYRSTTPDTFRSLSNFGNLYTLNPTESGTRGFTALRSDDWATTIQELSKLDCVVSVDTSIVHLCGALGMPCIVVMGLKNNDFRWGDSSCGTMNKWYSSVRVVRNPGSWKIAMSEVANELKDLQNGVW